MEVEVEKSTLLETSNNITMVSETVSAFRETSSDITMFDETMPDEINSPSHSSCSDDVSSSEADEMDDSADESWSSEDDIYENPYICEECDKEFYTYESLEVHKCIKQYGCPICAKSFDTIGKLVVHTKIHFAARSYNYQKSLPAKRFRLDNESDLKSESIARVATAEDSEDRPYSCNICSKAFKCKSKLKCHVRTHSELYKCTTCMKTFSTKHNLKRHCKDVHNIEDYKYELVILNPLGKADEHDEDGMKPNGLYETGGKLNGLELDQKFFNGEKHNGLEGEDRYSVTVGELNSHDTNVKAYRCFECGKGFATPVGLKRHVKIHTNKFINGLCATNEMIPTSDVKANEDPDYRVSGEVLNDLISHISGTKSYTYDDPGKYAIANGTFDMYIDEYSNDSLTSEILSLLEGKSNEHKHQRSAEKSGEPRTPILKPYMCLECGKSFASKQYRKKHMKIHHQVKPNERVVKNSTQIPSALNSCNTYMSDYKCDGCDRYFMTRDILNMHALIHTEEHREDALTANNLISEMISTVEVKTSTSSSHYVNQRLKCEDCGKHFATKQSLKRHSQSHAKEHSKNPNAKEHSNSPNAKEYSKNPNMKEDSENPNVNEYSKNPNMKEHSQSPNVKEYSENPNMKEHSENPNVNEYSKNPNMKEHSENPNVNEYSKNPNMKEHSENPNAKEHSENPNTKEHSENPNAKEHSENPNMQEHSENPNVKEHEENPNGVDDSKPEMIAAPTERKTNGHGEDKRNSLELHGDLISHHIHVGPYICDFCSRQFTTYIGLRRHRIMHTEDPYIIKSLLSEMVSNVDAKMKAEHIDNAPKYKCEECGKLLTSKKGFKQHLKLHERNKNIDARYITHNGGKGSGLEEDRNGGGFVKHGDSRDAKPFKCDCGKAFANKQYLNRHAKIHTKELGNNTSRVGSNSRSSTTGVYKCNCCGKGFTTSDILKMHTLTHYEQHSEDMNVVKDLISEMVTIIEGKGDVLEESVNSSEIHTNDLNSSATHVVAHKCDICQNCFTTSDELKLHLVLHSEETMGYTNGVDSDFVSDIINPTVGNYDEHGGNSLEIPGDSLYTEDKSFECPECNKSFNSISGLNRHAVIHRGQSPFVCKICGKQFPQFARLTRHIRSHEKLFKCPDCDKAFGESYTLKRHMKIHSEPTAQGV